jgi:hypothetical protein
MGYLWPITAAFSIYLSISERTGELSPRQQALSASLKHDDSSGIFSWILAFLEQALSASLNIFLDPCFSIIPLGESPNQKSEVEARRFYKHTECAMRIFFRLYEKLDGATFSRIFHADVAPSFPVKM